MEHKRRSAANATAIWVCEGINRGALREGHSEWFIAYDVRSCGAARFVAEICYGDRAMCVRQFMVRSIATIESL
jgi:hypothetical protein